MPKKKKRPHGHYCKICGEYKANEKFSGKGHAAHICKACSRLSATEKAAAMAMNRLMRFPMRRLSDSEKKWLLARKFDNDIIFRRFLCGCCGDASDLSLQYLLENNNLCLWYILG